MSVTAVQQIRRMRGGAQAHLMLADDGNLYVVKFQNNPQHARVLANEWIATLLARRVGLTVPECKVIKVDKWLIEGTQEMTVNLGERRMPCQAGRSFGSRFVGGLMPMRTFDYLPEEYLMQLGNLEEFAGMLAFDKWTCNTDHRQAVYTPQKRRRHKYLANFIDFGHCFGAGEWQFRDAPLRGTVVWDAYRDVVGWASFEPWLSQIETFELQEIWAIAAMAPVEWHGYRNSSLEALVESLGRRRSKVRDLIGNFRRLSPERFPNWRSGHLVASPIDRT